MSDGMTDFLHRLNGSNDAIQAIGAPSTTKAPEHNIDDGDVNVVSDQRMRMGYFFVGAAVATVFMLVLGLSTGVF